MKGLLLKFYWIFVLPCFVVSVGYSQDEFQLVETRIVDYLKADVTINSFNKDVSANAQTINSNGAWADLDYSSTAETAWKPLLHLNRIKQFSLAIALNNFDAVKKENLALHTVSGLRYWLAQNPKSKNWFQNDIASPTAIGEVLMLLQHKNILPITLQDSLLKSMDQGNVIRAVGANKLDIATHFIYRACVTKDKALMDFAVQQAFMPISIGKREGLQADYSYLQHGPQLQIASYGQVFLTGTYKVASWLLGTSYALPAEKLNMLDHYLNETFLKTIRGRYIDFSTEGRGVSRNDVLDKISITEKAGVNNLLALAKKVNPLNVATLNDVEQRILQKEPASFKVKPAHLYFWKADYTIHTRPTYSFNVRAVSKRTIRAEAGNKENLLAKFLPDGATNIQRSGAEYYNIMPIWEWDKIPGITGRDYSSDQKITIEWGERGIESFIGGVSDGLYGASVYQLNYNEVLAKKAWFFFDDEVVCLGAGINSYAKEPITTTINQAWQKGKIKAFINQKITTVEKALTSKDLQWVWQDSIGYYFPKGGELKLSNELQTGSWNLINENRAKDKISGKVFKLWFNHGIDPSNQSYAYIVKPGISEKEMINNPSAKSKILVNDNLMQAVKNEDLQMVQVVFYQAGTLIDQQFELSVDQPCVLMIKNIGTKNPIISIADPTQQLTNISFTLKSEVVKVTEPILVTFPQGDDKGASVSIQIK